MQRYYFMKKISLTIIIISCFLFISTIKASEKIPVHFIQCVDGDTAKFEFNNKIITARFLAIDTPETKHPTKGEEAWGKEASNFTCNQLKTANKIELEYDANSNQLDKYERHLVWVWVDDELLQNLIIKNGLAKVTYLYGDYKYTSLLQTHEKIAQKEKLGIWGESPIKKINYKYIIIIMIGIVIIYLIGSKKTKKKIKNKIKKRIKKEIKDRL